MVAELVDEQEGVPEGVEAVLAHLESRSAPEPAPLARTTTTQDVDLDKIARISRAMIASGYFQDVRSVAQAAVKILAGSELGIPPLASMVGIYIVQGRVQLSAQVMAALIKKSGRYDYRLREHTNQRCAIEFFEHGQSLGLSEYSIEDAKRAGLVRSGQRGPSPWEAHPRNMLFARSMSNGAKWFCPDILAGPTFVPGELDQPEEEGREIAPPAE